MEMENNKFIAFDDIELVNKLVCGLTFSLENELHPLCLLAAEKLQLYLQEQQEWKHNFGLSSENAEGTVIGKMFGVLVVRTKQNEVGYLAAFSGKLAGANHHSIFVPPVFDTLADGGFVNSGMRQLTHINAKIGLLESFRHAAYKEQIEQLKLLRKDHSFSLQNRIFDQYRFINKAGESRSLIDIFNKKPPAGAGECAAPKLLQYAFTHEMQPLALAEFWWGLSPKSSYWKHKHFYAPCKEKCGSILEHMLG